MKKKELGRLVVRLSATKPEKLNICRGAFVRWPVAGALGTERFPLARLHSSLQRWRGAIWQM